MKGLLIIIEMLVGSYQITIQDNYVVTTSKVQDSEEVTIMSVLDMATSKIYRFDKNRLVITQDLNPQKHFKAPTKLVSSHSKECVTSDLGQNCKRFINTFDAPNILVQGKTGIIEVEQILCEISIIDAYISEDHFKSQLAFIGGQYGTIGKFILESQEITLGSENNVLVHRVLNVTELTNINPRVHEAIEIVKGVKN